MGILADLFVASGDDALQYEELLLGGGGIPRERFERVEYKGFTGLEFGTLWAIVAGEEWDVEKHMPVNLGMGPEGESWLDKFPDEMVTAFAALRDDRLPQIADSWARTEELNCEAEELMPVLQDLRRLCQLSLRTGKGVYLWGSL